MCCFLNYWGESVKIDILINMITKFEVTEKHCQGIIVFEGLEKPGLDHGFYFKGLKIMHSKKFF